MEILVGFFFNKLSVKQVYVRKNIFEGLFGTFYINFSIIDIMTKIITKRNFLHPNVTKNEIQNIQHVDVDMTSGFLTS